MQKTALLSVSDKSGLVPFAKALVEQHGYRLLSTGGTAKLLEKEGIPVTEVSDYTGFPEMMEGRVLFVPGGPMSMKFVRPARWHRNAT